MCLRNKNVLYKKSLKRLITGTNILNTRFEVEFADEIIKFGTTILATIFGCYVIKINHD